MTPPTTILTLGTLWGDRVAARRAELGLSQAQFASLVGVTQQTISKIETGILVPHDKLKVQIAQKSGTLVSALFAWPDGWLELRTAA